MRFHLENIGVDIDTRLAKVKGDRVGISKIEARGVRVVWRVQVS